MINFKKIISFLTKNVEQHSNDTYESNAKWIDFNFVHFVQFCPISSISSGVLDILQKSGQNNNPAPKSPHFGDPLGNWGEECKVPFNKNCRET